MTHMIAYWLPKDGTATVEWEDGAAYSNQAGWFAVADGASTGNSSREWAYALVKAFVTTRAATGEDEFVRWVDATRRGFEPHSEEFPASRVPDWVRAAGDRRGAYATFLGGYIADREVRAIAVGDCCLFHLRPHVGAPTCFPLSSPKQFGTSPALISSHPGDDTRMIGAAETYRAPVAPGDVIFVASDALAEWLVRNAEDPHVWRVASTISYRGFQALCRDLRRSGQMKNDDVTLWRASITNPHKERS